MTKLQLFATSVACVIGMALTACGGGLSVAVPGGVQTPGITSQPVNQSVMASQSATFSVAATGSATLSFQWKKYGSNITGGTGATTSTYTTPAMGYAGNGKEYSVVVSNSAGSVTSSKATLTVSKSFTAKDYGLVANASDDLYGNTECVQDNNTGLVWEGKTASAGRASQHTCTLLGRVFAGAQ
ncbi:MAG: hypothetical protein ORN29_05460 [Rhodoferax sp.]|nr:hypothetical protein [Rhodoferax sp.]